MIQWKSFSKATLAVAAVALFSGAAWASASIPPPRPVPEPGSMAVLAGGLAATVLLARLRRRK